MDAQTREAYRAQLIALRDALVAAGDQKLPTLSDGVHERVDDDAAPLNAMHQAIASNRNALRTKELKEIREALEKIELYPDEYGLCEECEEAISKGRLKLKPAGKLCVKCQEKTEGGRGHRRKSLTDFA